MERNGLASISTIDARDLRKLESLGDLHPTLRPLKLLYGLEVSFGGYCKLVQHLHVFNADSLVW